MKSYLITTIASFLTLFLAVSAQGDQLSIPPTVDRILPFPSGEFNVEAIGFGDDGFLWIGGRDTNQFYRLNPSDGAVLQSFSDGNTSSADIDVHAGILYGLEEPNKISRFDTSTGAQLSSIEGPVIGGTRGLTFLSGHLYVSGVISAGKGVQIGKADSANGNLLASVDAQDLVPTSSLGRIGDNLGYLVGPEMFEEVHDIYLNIVNPLTGELLEKQVLFTAYDDLWGLDASDQELFVARRDLGQILVYTIPEPATLSLLMLGGLMFLPRRR